MPNLSRQIAIAMTARLQSVYQTNMNAAAADYGIDPETVEFALGNAQFFSGQFRIDDLEKNVGDALKYPVVMLYGRGATNLRETKPAKFAGQINMGMDIVHAFPITDFDLGNDYESILDCTFETMVQTFNSGVPFTPAGCSYPGRLDELPRGPWVLSDREQEYTRRQQFVFGFYSRM